MSDLSWTRSARNAAFNVLTGGRIKKLEAERDRALSERDAALAERDKALSERDAALAERDKALSERDAALAERDKALSERDAALATRLAGLETKLSDQAKELAKQSARLQIIGSEIELQAHEVCVQIRNQQSSTLEMLDLKAGDDAVPRSQLGQDLWVLERTGYKRSGFFVEFGATDGISLSNTYLLERKFGWNGICAEPNPEFFDSLRKNRSCIVSRDCIGSETGDHVEFVLADVFGGISAYGDKDQHKLKRDAYAAEGKVIAIETISLEDFLRKHEAPYEIDYLSIDTEGSEYAILEKFPFDKWQIRLITVEHNFTNQRQQIRELLEKHGYTCTETKWDDWYELQI